MSWLEQDALLSIKNLLIAYMFVPGAVAIQKWNFPLFLVTNVMLEWAKYELTGLSWIHILTTSVFHQSLSRINMSVSKVMSIYLDLSVCKAD